jgi:hypothetical protein
MEQTIIRLILSRKNNFNKELLNNIDLNEILSLSKDELWYIFFDHPNSNAIDYIVRNCINIQIQSINDIRFIDYVCMSANLDTIKYLVEEKKYSFDHLTVYNTYNVLLSCCLNSKIDPIKYSCYGLEIFKYFINKGLTFNIDDFRYFMEFIIVNNNTSFLDYFATKFNLDYKIKGERIIYRLIHYSNKEFLKKYLKYVKITSHDKFIITRRINDAVFKDELKIFFREYCKKNGLLN